MRAEGPVPSFRAVPRTGVIYVMTEAAKLGYEPGDARWANLGQGMPETASRAAPRDAPRSRSIPPIRNTLGRGTVELREAVAGLYNQRASAAVPSRYTAENVAIRSGARRFRAWRRRSGRSTSATFCDYTAYEELLDVFRSFTAIPILLEPEAGYAFTPEALKREIRAAASARCSRRTVEPNEAR